MRNPLTTRALKTAATTVVAGVALAGCNIGFNPSTIPAPGQPGGGDGYVVHLDFTNVLNLPDRARVVYDGVVSGRLQKVTLEQEKAVVDIEISERPANSKLDNYIFVYIRAQGRITKSAHNDP